MMVIVYGSERLMSSPDQNVGPPDVQEVPNCTLSSWIVTEDLSQWSLRHHSFNCHQQSQIMEGKLCFIKCKLKKLN